MYYNPRYCRFINDDIAIKERRSEGMKKMIALAVCVVQFLFSSCIADTTTMKRISSKPLHTHFSIIDNQVYVTL